MDATVGGEWLATEQLQAMAEAAVVRGGNLEISLKGVTHLEAGVLQLLLTLGAEQRRRGHGLLLREASDGVLSWFEYAGAREHFSFAQDRSGDA